MDDGYIAGFFDADGSVSIQEIKGYRYAYLVWTNTNREVIEAIRAYIGVKRKIGPYPQGPHKPRYKLVIGGHRLVKSLLERMLPYLIVKREGAMKAIELINSKEWAEDRSKQYAEKIRTLYWGQGMSSVQIGKVLGKSPEAIRSKMEREGIPRRSIQEAQKLRKEKNREK